jgi:DNA-binding transcriptional ArsR family regulator
MDAYHPTLWRTCRVLANAGRVRCLKVVLGRPLSTVGEIARLAEVSETVASEHLRALQARGLIRARRESRWVRYSPDPDPLVKGARRLLAALRRALLVEDGTESAVIRTLTAFTHPRRLEILRRLQRVESALPESLIVHTRISQPALSRHLGKLESRRLVACDGRHWRLVKETRPLEKTLLALLSDCAA